MKIFRRDIIRSCIQVLFIGIVALFVVNKSLFSHAHKLSNGTVVYHAHFYDKAGESDEPYKTHHHTTSDWVILEALEHIFFCFLVLGTRLLAWKKLRTTIEPFIKSIQKIALLPPLRAPPLF